MNGAAGVFAPWVIFGDDIGALGNSANEGEVITLAPRMPTKDWLIWTW
ncbi:hypothetical protein [Rappaport israeli]|nr:hypothetical protein [Rappaport israeli]